MNDMDLVNDLMTFFKVGYSIAFGCVVLLLFILAVCIVLRISDKPIDEKEE